MPATPHPALVLRQLGVRDRHVAVAIVLLLMFQALVTGVVFRNYQQPNTGYAVTGSLAPILIPLPFVVALVTVIWLLVRAIHGDARHRQIIKPANNPSFDGLRAELEQVHQRSSLTAPVDLLYHPRNADASYAMMLDKRPAIVLGPGFRDLHKKMPLLVRAVIAHEVSHVELNETQRETWLRRGLWFYSILVAGLFGSVWMMLVFFQPEIVGGRVLAGLGSMIPKPDPDVLSRFGGNTILVMLDVLAVLIFGFFFVVRRELIHDFRASQLSESTVLADAFFSTRCQKVRSRGTWAVFAAKCRAFVGLHPSDCERAKRIHQRDFIALNAGLFPAVCGMLFPALLLLTIPAQEIFGWSKNTATIFALGVVALLTFLVLRADSVRIGVSVVTRRFSILVFLRYCFVLAGFSIVTGMLLAIWSAYRNDHTINHLFAQWVGLFFGALRLFVLYAATLAMLGYLSAVRICALGDSRPQPYALLAEQTVAVLLALFGQAAVSSKAPALAVAAAILALAVAIVGLLLIFCRARCHQCRRWRWEILRADSKCEGCHHEHAALLRNFTNYPPSTARLNPELRPPPGQPSPA